MSPEDQLGKFGEALVQTELSSFFGQQPALFWPVHLGEKFPTFDFLVKLEGGVGGGAFFFAQVKTTRETVGKRGRLRSRLSVDDVAFALSIPVPSYLFSVTEASRTVYITAINAKLTGGISSIPAKYPVNAVNVQVLWEEVRRFWQSITRQRITSRFSL